MSSDYVGSLVRVHLSNGTNVEGRVTTVSPSSVSLSDVQGSSGSCVDLYSHEISDIDILSLSPPVPPKPITIMRRSDCSPNGNTPSSPPRSHQDMEPRKPSKNETFAISTSNMGSDFDFQSSNKLFKKEAIFEEWRQKDGVHGTTRRGNPEKLRNTDMVIDTSPDISSQCAFQGDFVTDEKIPVTGLTLTKRIALFKRAIGHGLNYSHVVSVAGITIAQMVIQVLGGSCRINAHNHNKPPVVAMVVASGESGKVALATALHLHQHSVIVKVIVKAVPKGCDGLLNILNKSGCLVVDFSSLPKVLDIIVDGSQDRNTLLAWPPWMDDVVEWRERQNSVPLLAIDPQHPSQLPRVPPQPKWTCTLGAPLLSQGKEGRLFLVDIGLFSMAFSEEGIPYQSPFFDKFIVPINRSLK